MIGSKYCITPDEMIGNTFNRLTILERRYEPKHRRTKFLCKCECGNECIVDRQKILSGHTKSCGCLQKEKTSKAKYIHGQAGVNGKNKSDLYRVWSSMKERCQNPNNKAYKNYGERGIVVCDEWQDFTIFNSWAKDTGYKKGLTIDRIDNDKGYNPDNCRWATRTEQGRNKRNTIFIKHKGKEMPLVALAEKKSIKYRLLYDRLFSQGWDINKAVNEPVKRRKV